MVQPYKNLQKLPAPELRTPKLTSAEQRISRAEPSRWRLEEMSPGALNDQNNGLLSKELERTRPRLILKKQHLFNIWNASHPRIHFRSSLGSVFAGHPQSHEPSQPWGYKAPATRPQADQLPRWSYHPKTRISSSFKETPWVPNKLNKLTINHLHSQTMSSTQKEESWHGYGSKYLKTTGERKSCSPLSYKKAKPNQKYSMFWAKPTCLWHVKELPKAPRTVALQGKNSS